MTFDTPRSSQRSRVLSGDEILCTGTVQKFCVSVFDDRGFSESLSGVPLKKEGGTLIFLLLTVVHDPRILHVSVTVRKV